MNPPEACIAPRGMVTLTYLAYYVSQSSSKLNVSEE